MARFRLAANAEVDMLTRDELHGELHEFAKEWSERGRAEKYMEAVLPNANGAAVGPNAGFVCTPETPNSGYAWAMRSVGFQTAAAAIANLWKVADPASTNPNNYVKIYGRDTSNTIHGFQFSSLQFVLKAGEFAAISTQAAQTLAGSVFLVYVEVPEAELWKLE